MIHGDGGPAWLGAAAAILFASCTTTHDLPARWEPTPTRSGERLRVLYLEAEDGSRWPSGWYDRTIDAPCELAFAGDGTISCQVLGEEDLAYLMGCEEVGLVRHLPPACLASFGLRLLDDGGSACEAPVGSARASYRLDGSPSGRGYRWMRGMSGCFADTDTYGDEHRAQPLRDLVTVVVEPPEVGFPALARYRVSTADGALGMQGLYDVARGAACFIPERGNLEVAAPCVPLDAARVAAASASCEERLAFSRGCVEPVAAYAIEGGCRPFRVTTLATGPVVPYPSIACGNGDAVAFETRPSDASYPTLRAELRGDGRLRARVWVAEGGLVEFDPWLDGFHDTARGERCWPFRPGPGEDPICLPTNGPRPAGAQGRMLNDFWTFRSPVFADPACTEPGLLAASADCGSAYALIGTEPEALCDARLDRVVRLGESLGSSWYVRQPDGTCEARASLDAVVRAFEEVPLTDFARLREVVD